MGRTRWTCSHMRCLIISTTGLSASVPVPACLQYHASGSVPGRCSDPMACLVSSASGKAVAPPRLGLARSACRVWASRGRRHGVKTRKRCTHGTICGKQRHQLSRMWTPATGGLTQDECGHAVAASGPAFAGAAGRPARALQKVDAHRLRHLHGRHAPEALPLCKLWVRGQLRFSSSSHACLPACGRPPRTLTTQCLHRPQRTLFRALRYSLPSITWSLWASYCTRGSMAALLDLQPAIDCAATMPTSRWCTHNWFSPHFAATMPTTPLVHTQLVLEAGSRTHLLANLVVEHVQTLAKRLWDAQGAMDALLCAVARRVSRCWGPTAAARQVRLAGSEATLPCQQSAALFSANTGQAACAPSPTWMRWVTSSCSGQKP